MYNTIYDMDLLLNQSQTQLHNYEGIKKSAPYEISPPMYDDVSGGINISVQLHTLLQVNI